MKMNSVGKTLMHANSINALTISREKTASGTALVLRHLYVQMQVVFLQVDYRMTYAQTETCNIQVCRLEKHRSLLWRGEEGRTGERQCRKGINTCFSLL